MKNSPTIEKNNPNKVVHKGTTQETPKIITKRISREPWIDSFVTSQLQKAKHLAAVHPGKDEVHEKDKRNKQYANNKN